MSSDSEGYNKKRAGSFTLEMKLYEMKSHIDAMNKIYQKYLNAENEGILSK